MNRDYRDYPASIWDAIGDVDQGICCAALGGVVWDFVSHLTPAQLLAAMDSAALETLRAIRDILEDDTLEDPECVQRIKFVRFIKFMNSLLEVLFMAALATEGRLSLYEPYKPYKL